MIKLKDLVNELSTRVMWDDLKDDSVSANWIRQHLLSDALEIINHKNNMLKKDLESENIRLRKKIKSNNYLVKELLSTLIEDEKHKEKALEVKTKLGIKINKSAVLEIKTELTHEVLESLKNNIDAKDLVISYRGLNISADNVNVRGFEKKGKLDFHDWLNDEGLNIRYYMSNCSNNQNDAESIREKYNEYLNS